MGAPVPPVAAGAAVASAIPWAEVGKGLLSGVADVGPPIFIQLFGEEVTVRILATVAGTWIRWQSQMPRLMGEALGRVEAEAGPTMRRMAAFGLSDLFDTNVSPEGLQGPGGVRDTAGKLGNIVFDNLFSAFEATGKITPQKGAINARRAISYNLNLALEGWMQGVLSKGMLSKWFPGWGDLDDIVSQNLGLGRISRRVLAPVINTLIVEPFTQDLNATFTPSLMTEAQLVRARARGHISAGEYTHKMRLRGWDTEDAGELYLQNLQLPSESDLGKMIELGMATPDQAVETLQAKGFPPDVAAAKVKLMREDRFLALRAGIGTQARAMFEAREISEEELSALLEQAGYSQLEQQTIRAAALLARSRPTTLPRSEMEAAYRDGIVELPELRAYYEQQGYAPRSIEILETVAVRERLAAELKKAALPPARPPEAGKPLAQGTSVQLFVRGLVDETRLRVLLGEVNLRGANLESVVALAKAQRAAFLDAQRKKLAPKAAITGSAGTIDEAFVRGLVGKAELVQFYAAAGFGADHIPLLVALREAERADFEARRARAEAAAAARGHAERP